MLGDLGLLRAAAAGAFSRKDLAPVLWAGIFGSFAVGKQTPASDVDVVVIHGPEYDEWWPPETPFLEDLLPEAWGRKVDIINIVGGKELRGYISIESLLCSQTIYGSVEEPAVAAVRRKAQDIFDSGIDNFKRVLDDIQRTRAMVSGVSSLEEFDSSPQIRNTVRGNVRQILRSITAHPRWHPMSEGFWFRVVEKSTALQEEMDALEGAAPATTEDNAKFWEFLWHITTTTRKLEGLNGLGLRIQRFVFPIFELTWEKAKMARKFASELDTPINDINTQGLVTSPQANSGSDSKTS